MSDVVISMDSVNKSYRDGANSVPVLKGATLSVEQGEIVAVIGASGSGKSTLLHVMSGLDTIDSGSVSVTGMNVHSLNEKALTQLRNTRLGFIYQFHHLLPEFSALENVAMPLWVRRMSKEQACEKAKEVLISLGLGQRLNHLPSQLSGGERQRCAIARAMVTDPACILADEPTGNLDGKTARGVFDKLLELSRQKGTAAVIVTHDATLAALCDRVLTLTDGQIRTIKAR